MSFAGSVSTGFESIKLDPLKCRDGSRPRILLAEDSPAARVLTGALLKRIGCNVDAAEHGEEAVNYVKNGDYDLILMDIEMPVMDGVVAAKKIRTMGGNAAKTPIVALSAFLADTQKSAFWQKHFDIALAKPAGKQQLYAAISQILKLQPALAEQRPDRSTEITGSCQDIEANKLQRILLNICDEDKAMLLKTASFEISKYSSELAISHHRPNKDGMSNALHKLCGLAATFAATALNNLVLSLLGDVRNSTEGNLEKRVQDICECAERTALVLKEKIRDLPEVSE